MCREFQRRRDYVVDRLRRVPGVRLPAIGGAFYAFCDIRTPLERARRHGIGTSLEWCAALLDREQVATVAGSAFGAEGHVRMSFAASDERLATGLDRIERFLAATTGG